tara:strand:+ start:242 stop:766 length:525 start_codon:yes stop_codon:yes gene_type:complete
LINSHLHSPSLNFLLEGITIAILEAISAANAAYSIIKTACANGKEGASVIAAVGKFIGAEEEAKEAVRKKKSNPILALTGSTEEQWKEFEALERMREQREELISYMRLYCRAGTYDRFKIWEQEARKQRQAARRAAEKRRAEMIEAIQLTIGIGIACVVVAAGFWFLGRYLGRW